MTPTEIGDKIRNLKFEFRTMAPGESARWLQEIAAQLAELNAQLREAAKLGREQ